MAPHEELAAWIALRRAGLGSVNFALLLAHFGTIAAAWRAPADQVGRAGLDPQFQRAVAKATFQPDQELRLLEEHGARVTTWMDETSHPRCVRFPRARLCSSYAARWGRSSRQPWR